jgi:hypothetical protein
MDHSNNSVSRVLPKDKTKKNFILLHLNVVVEHNGRSEFKQNRLNIPNLWSAK